MFVVRALNHGRREFLPTYVGTRLMLAGTARKRVEGFYTSLVQHRATSGRTQSYHSHQIYKNTGKDNIAKYRTCASPSPTSLLVESYALQRMALDGAFQPSAAVYSYNWPKEQSGHCFKYFFEGYRERYLSVKGVMETDTENLCVVTVDIKNFYPSVNKEALRKAFYTALGESAADNDDKRVLEFATNSALNVEGPGLPVGPPISHALANVALLALDDKLWEKYGSSYHRYVDDIAVVVYKTDADETIRTLNQAISDYGYEVNEDKTDVIDYKHWILSVEEEDPAYSFSLLRAMITELAVTNHEGMQTLRASLLKEGFNLPFGQYAHISNGVRWQGYFKGLLRMGKNKLLVSPAYGRPKYILDYAVRVRDRTLARVRAFDADNCSSADRRASAQIKRLLRSVQSLFYMFPPQDLGFLKDHIPDVPETKNTLALISACASADASYVLAFPGKTVSAFAQLWSEDSYGKPRLDVRRTFSAPELDALSTLALAGTVNVNEARLSFAYGESKSDLFDFCTDIEHRRRERSDLSYIDELMTLKLSGSRVSHAEILSSRYDAGEDVILEGLYVSDTSSV